MIFFDEGLTVLGVSRSGANAFPNEHNFVIPTVDNVTGTAFVAGDLCVAVSLQNNINADGIPPPFAIPSGFTSVGLNITGNTASGLRGRCAAAYKILAAADLGATKSFMPSTDNGRIMVCSIRMNRPIQSVVIGGLDSTPSGTWGGNPASQSLNTLVAATAGQNVIALMVAIAENDVTSFAPSPTPGGTPYVFPADATDATGITTTPTRSIYRYTPAGEAHVNYTFDIGDFGDYNVLVGFYLILT